MNRNIYSLNLSSHVLTEFDKIGIFYAKDVTSDDLEDHGISEEEWLELNKAPQTKTALDLYYEQINTGYIITLIPALDNALGGGIQLGQITEFCGLPGSGRTHMCLQLSINVQLPEWCGGLDGETFYVHTSNCFNIPRLEEIADKALERYNNIKKSENANISDHFDKENMLKRISTLKIKDVVELIALPKYIKGWIKEHKLKLLVIDSIIYPFKHFFDYKKWRNIIYTLLSQLQKLATENDFAIVLTNDMTTKFHARISIKTSCLSESFFHRVNTRVMLSKMKEQKNTYKAKIEKHLLSKSDEVVYELT